MKVKVVFRGEDEKLCSMFTETFKSVEDAKAAIETDALAFIDAHNHPSKAYGSLHVIAHWFDKKHTDYYKVRAKDGSICYWQYFAEK